MLLVSKGLFCTILPALICALTKHTDFVLTEHFDSAKYTLEATTTENVLSMTISGEFKFL